MAASIENLARQWTLAQPAVAMFIGSLITDVHDAQDVLQDVAAAVFSQGAHSAAEPRAFTPWVLGIARHKALDYYRRRNVQRRTLLMDAVTVDQLAQASEIISDEIDLRRDALHQCLSAIGEKPRRLLDLRYKMGFSVQEIAEQTQAGVSAIKMNLHRVRLALRACIERRLSLAAKAPGGRA
jgi:RNA polymerase sigma-70 factor, ECF subfamily